MPSKPVSVRVTTMDAELEFAIQSSTTGKQLFDQVVKTIGLREIWYFGLQYVDTKGYIAWLKLNKKVLKQQIKKENPLQFKFRAKFFPEDVSEEIIQDITLRLFYLQVREAILSDDIYCPAETTVLLASYAMQAKYGDYLGEKRHQKNGSSGHLANDRLLPDRVKDQFKLSPDQWEERIVTWWTEHRGMLKEDAMMEYLKIAQDLEMYGVSYFEISNKKTTPLWLGVDALGLNIYEKNDRLSPKIGFPWSEIRNISFNDKKFVIKPVDKKAPDFVFYAARLSINKRILALCMGNHELYMRRRKPDTIEVQQMKAQAKEERANRSSEREKLQKEIAARQAAEQKQKEYELKLSEMQENMARAQKELLEAQSTIHRLENQLAETEKAKEQLDKRERELEEMTKLLASEREMEHEEKESLAREIRRREMEIDSMRQTVEHQNEETRRLQREVAEAHQRHIIAQEALIKASSKTLEHTKLTELSPPRRHEMHPTANGHCKPNNETFHARSASPQFDRDRTPHTDRDVNVKAKLEALNSDLERVRDENKVTEFDVLHMENKRAGRDKYKTLRQIRSGNTQRRIDQFENMA